MHDVIVVGGGPAGSTLAARLARRGRRVAVFEKERFPRFHIGESLLPCSMPLFEELGILPALEQAKFLPKYGAEFVSADGVRRRRYAFADGMLGGPPSAFEVDRSEFDKVLLDHAAKEGATVEEECQVKSFRAELGSPAEVTVRDKDGRERIERAELLVDATGQQALFAGRLGLRRMEPDLRNFAVFSHFEGALRAEGLREGDISVVLVNEGWWWVIPLRGDRTSVGLVGRASSLAGRKPDEGFLSECIAASPYLSERLAPARRVAPVRTISDWSYKSSALAGDRWLMVGDAGAFIDPVFSTGVYLGMKGAFLAADFIEEALDSKRFERSRFDAYERRMRKLVSTYTDFVKGFYTPEFAELLLHPSDKFQLRAAITSLLAGHGNQSFSLSWRVALFKFLARLNRRLPLTPRLAGRRASEELPTGAT